MAPDDDRERFYRGVARLKADLLKLDDEEPPLLVLGQGDFKRVYTGDDFRVTNLAPLFGRAARRCYGALLSFLRVRR